MLACAASCERIAGAAAQPRRTPQLVESTQQVRAHIGFDAAFEYATYPYAHLPGLPDRLASLGFGGGLRDGGTVAIPQTDYLFATYGIRHGVGFYLPSSCGGNGCGSSSGAAYVRDAVGANGGCREIAWVEADNEFDAGPGNFRDPYTTWHDEDVADQKLLYRTVKPLCPAVPVLTTPLADPRNASAIAAEAPFADAASSHDSTGNGTAPELGGRTVASLAPLRAAFPGKPIWTTEWSYADAQPWDAGPAGKIADSVIARYEMRSIGYRLAYAREARVYQFQAVQVPEDPVFGSTGVIFDRFGDLLPAGYAFRTALNFLPATRGDRHCSAGYAVPFGDVPDVYEFLTYDAATCRHYTWLWLGVASGPGPAPEPPEPEAYPLHTPDSGALTVTLPAGDSHAAWCRYADATFASMTCAPLAITRSRVTLGGANAVDDRVGFLVSGTSEFESGTTRRPVVP